MLLLLILSFASAKPKYETAKLMNPAANVVPLLNFLGILFAKTRTNSFHSSLSSIYFALNIILTVVTSFLTFQVMYIIVFLYFQLSLHWSHMTTRLNMRKSATPSGQYRPAESGKHSGCIHHSCIKQVTEQLAIVDGKSYQCYSM